MSNRRLKILGHTPSSSRSHNLRSPEDQLGNRGTVTFRERYTPRLACTLASARVVNSPLSLLLSRPNIMSL
jgi:hypothetical protein